MMMYMKIMHKKQWKDIKSSKVVLSYLEKHSIYVYIDKFNSEKVGSLGFVTKIHPKLVNLSMLKYRIQEALKNAMCNREKVIEEWKNLYQDIETDGNTIPNFILLVQNHHWGQPPTRVEATVVVKQSAAKDMQYLKAHLSEVYCKGIKDT
eukprot:8496980-Ditylum_brightwellii.AAC.1